MENVKKLSFITKLKYGVGDFGMALVSAMLQFSMLIYYTDVVGVNPGLAGTAILVGKLAWDMVNDVLFGYFEDKTKSRWGKRRPYLIFCAVPLALSFWLVYSIPQGLNDVAYFFIIVGTFILFDTFHTLIATAYSAMTAEITSNYDERTSLTTVRMVFSIIGYLLGAGTTSLLAGILSNALNVSIHTGWSIVGLIFGSLAGISMLIPGIFLKYKPEMETEDTKFPPIKSVLQTLKNKPFRSFLVVSMIMSISFTMVTTMLQYFINHQLQMESDTLFIMLTMLGVLAVFLIPCGLLINKIGKAKTYAVGLGFSAQWVCPHAMMPDVIEVDELQTGERREGVYYGMHATSTKVTGALASAMCGWGLEIGRYVEGAGAIQPDSAILAIKALFALIPAIFLIICIPLLIKYPITKQSHEEVLRKLEELRKAKANEN